VSSGYGRSRKEALSSGIKNFFDLLLEDQEFGYVTKKIILKVHKNNRNVFNDAEPNNANDNNTGVFSKSEKYWRYSNH
jgi:hypothetical protein